MIIVIRVIFIVVSGTLGFLIADSLNISFIRGIAVGLIGSIIIVIVDIFSGKISIKDLLAILIGLTLGLIVASLFSYGLSNVPLFQSTKYAFFPLIFYLVCIYFGIIMALKKKDEFTGIKGFIGGKSDKGASSAKILDTSVIIDGRVAEILELGFIDGELVVPKFVLHELQMIADSPDAIKRNRGRRGLDILSRMQKASAYIRIYEDDFSGVNNVDEKILLLAKKIKAKVVTNDFNLNKVAEVEKIKVLNINDLSNAIKPFVFPGEMMRAKILKEGKEANQGVAYLEDGTMIVVDGAKNFINKELDIVITSAIQTSAGRMIFARKKEDE